MPMTFKVTAPYTYSLTGQNKSLDFNFSADIQKANQQSLVWDLSLDAKSAQQDVIGGGIVFKFDLANLSKEMGEPVLLPNNSGWTWGNTQSRQIEMRFEPPLASAYFEMGNKAQLRAFFIK